MTSKVVFYLYHDTFYVMVEFGLVISFLIEMSIGYALIELDNFIIYIYKFL